MKVSRVRVAYAAHINVAGRPWIGVRSTSGQEATSADDLRKGHQLATMVVRFVVAAPDQAHMPILNPPAPSFDFNCSTYAHQCRLVGKFHNYNA
jgi:hypothetical protein